MGRNGRPVKLTPELQNEICKVIRAGNYIETAAAFAGVSKQTLYNWMRKGRQAKSGKYREFLDAVKKALAESEVRDVMIIAKAAEENWQAAAWRLERKFPDRWGRKDRIDANLEHSGNITHRHIDLSSLSMEELEALEKIAARIQSNDELMDDEE